HRLPYAPNRGDRIRAFHMLRSISRHADVDLVSLVHDEEEASHEHDLDDIISSTTVVRVPRVRNVARAALALLDGTPLTHMLLDSPGVSAVIRLLKASHNPD